MWIPHRFVKYRFVRFVRCRSRFVRGPWLDTDTPSKHCICLQDVFKTSSKHLFKTSSSHVFRRLQVFVLRCLQDVFARRPWKVKNYYTEDKFQNVLKTNKYFLGIIYCYFNLRYWRCSRCQWYWRLLPFWPNRLKIFVKKLFLLEKKLANLDNCK